MAYTTIDKPTDYFETILWSAVDTSIDTLDFQPDWVWIKSRTNADTHVAFDNVRGANKRLSPSETAQESTTSDELTAFNSDGYTLGTGSNVNRSGKTYVGWNWLAQNGTSTNTDGSITSTVSANQTSGFSIVTTTGTGSSATIGHGLGSAPSMIIGKRRDSGSSQWRIYNKNLSSASHILFLDTSGAEQSGNSATWDNTDPTSSVFSVGSSGDVNASGGTFVFYCFAEKQGYSKFGEYEGNGSSNGTFVHTGFKPAWLMVKRYDSTGQWFMFDNKRLGYNSENYRLIADVNDTEADPGQMELLSNGFKWRFTSSNVNTSGGDYIYMAFAENPFVSSSGVAGTAR